MLSNVSYWSQGDTGACVADVGFTPESGHSQRRLRCPLSAISGHRPTELTLDSDHTTGAGQGSAVSAQSSYLHEHTGRVHHYDTKGDPSDGRRGRKDRCGAPAGARAQEGSHLDDHLQDGPRPNGQSER